MKVLAIKQRRLGDTVLWTAALEALRSHLGDSASLDIAYPKAYATLFRSDSRFRNQFLLESELWRNLKSIRAWRRARYDAVLNFHASPSSAWLSVLAQGRKKILHHHSRERRRFLSDRPIPMLGRPMSAVERDLNVVRALGWNGASPRPKVSVDPSWKGMAQARLKRLGVSVGEPLYLLGFRASRLAKQWPLEKYVNLMEQLHPHGQVGLVFEQVDELSDYYRLKFRTKATLIHTPRLEELMGLLGCATAYISSDSGAKHLAVAMGVPTVTLFGPESRAEWHGYPESRHSTIQIPVGCRDQDAESGEYAWCRAGVCPQASHACMSLISPEVVAEKVLELPH